MNNIPVDTKIHDLAFLKFKLILAEVKQEHLSFLCLCGYIFVEYFRPQQIYPQIDILPWAQLFILGSVFFSFLDKKVKWVNTSVFYVIVLLSINLVISTYTAYDVDVAKFWFSLPLTWFVITLAIINILITPKRIYIFVLILFAAGAKIALGTTRAWAMRGFSFTAWGLSGPPGYFENSGELAILMLTQFSLSLYLTVCLFKKSNKVEKSILLLGTIAPVFTIMGASSRGAQVALVAILILIFIRKLFKPKVFLSVLFFVFSISYLLPEEQIERFNTAGEDKSSQQRLLYWTNGIEMIKEYPVFGVGFFNFPRYFEDNYSDDMLYSVAQLPHNIFIQVGTDLGIVGLLLYLMLIIIAYRSYWHTVTQADKINDAILISISRGMWIGIIGFLIAGQFVSVAYYPFLFINLPVLVAIRNVISINSQKNLKRDRYGIQKK